MLPLATKLHALKKWSTRKQKGRRCNQLQVKKTKTIHSMQKTRVIEKDTNCIVWPSFLFAWCPATQPEESRKIAFHITRVNQPREHASFCLNTYGWLEKRRVLKGRQSPHKTGSATASRRRLESPQQGSHILAYYDWLLETLCGSVQHIMIFTCPRQMRPLATKLHALPKKRGPENKRDEDANNYKLRKRRRSTQCKKVML